jgi:PadR family transcriptional regulator, regulatory protein AphA
MIREGAAGMKKSSTLFAVLGVLSKAPSSGYDIRRQFTESLRYFWSESYGQIYPVLKEAVQLGYAVMQQDSTDSRNKKLYRITPAGEECFRSWLAEPVNPLNYRDELLLKVFFAKPEDQESIRTLFEREEAELVQAKEAYLEQERQLKLRMEEADYPMWVLTLRYGILSTEARLQWCRESIAFLTSMREK